MSQILFHKVVGSLPGSLEANSVYYVRTGNGFDIYITNDSGLVVAYELNKGTGGGIDTATSIALSIALG